MDYFSAVQEGRKRVNAAIAVLQAAAGPCYPMLFLKMGATNWTPVGEEMLQQVIPGKDNTMAVVICDSDGNAKTMSAWVKEERAREISKSLKSQDVKVFDGDVKLPI